MTITEAVPIKVEIMKGLNELSKTNLAFSKGTRESLQMAADVGDAITPFIPLIGAAATLITAIVDIYQTSQYNKRICNSLLDSARLAEIAIDQLIRRRQENEKNFKNKTWYKAFHRFVWTLAKMKKFGEKVSQLQGIHTFFKTNNIPEKFKELTNEYNNAIKDLDFTIMDIANEQQRKIDHESVKRDLNETNKFLEKINGGIEKNELKMSLIFEEVQSIKKKIDKSEDNSEFKRIDKSKLTEPVIGRQNDTRGMGGVERRIYMRSIEVACKPIRIPEKNTIEYKLLRRQFAIDIKATQLPNIIQFYGLSDINDWNAVMVCEWAEYGNLEDYYKKVEIPLELKLNYALHICRGIAYLNALNIYHRDLRCRNVMITEHYVAKITNFECTHEKTHMHYKSIGRQIESVRWTAPEKFEDSGYRYDHKCEIFSFGMLLWELAFEREPYEDREINEISNFVINGGREEIQFGLASPEINNVQKRFEKVIREAWAHDPDVRISISKLLIDIDTLAKSFVKPSSPSLQPQVININNDKDEEIPEYNGLDFDIDSVEEELEPIISISEGIKFHKARDFEKAWKCFDLQAENQNSVGKYWTAYYLWEGFAGQKDKLTALTLFKEAADDNVVDAQFHYACILLDKDLKLKHKINSKDAVKYLRLAADNGSGPAQFKIGEAYLKGILGYKQNLEIATLWYQRAAIQNDKNAKEKLKELALEELDFDY